MSDLIRREDVTDILADLYWADERLLNFKTEIDAVYDKILALPSADAVSREVYEETGGVVTIEKQNAKEVGGIKHIVIHSPNYTRYFYNESMPLPSAEAEPTVIRSKTLMPTKDFKEWAKRVRETNPNAVVIPCDAEVVSAESVQGWIPCSERLPEEVIPHRNYKYLSDYWCECGWHLGKKGEVKYCAECGRKVNWNG